MKKQPGTRVRWLVAAMVTALAAFGLGTGPAQAQPDTAYSVSGVFHEGEPGQVVYAAQTPEDWNGTLVLDLDFNRWSNERRGWFLERGYGIGGIQRTQNQTAYEIKKYVDDLIATRDELIAAGAPEPARTLAVGASRGGFVSRMAVEHRPDVFDGALAFAGGGAGVLGSWLGKADAVWTLKTLVDPATPLAINDLPDIPAGANYGPDYQQDAALVQLVDKARQDDTGMARLMLASAFEQATDWPSGSEQPAETDYEEQARRIAAGFAWANPQFVHKEIEDMAGGPVVWNHGVDYADLLERSGAIDRVRYWYKKAGLDLNADLAALGAADRYSADPVAVKNLEAEGTYTGDTAGRPVLSVKTIGDGADAVALDEAYTRTFEAAGTGNLVRSVFIGRAGHSTQTHAEFVTSFLTLELRLDSGVWPDTSADALNTLAATVSSTGGTAEEPNFIDYTPEAALRTWDVTNWNTYLSLYAQDLTARAKPGGPELVNALRNAARHLNDEKTEQACHALTRAADRAEAHAMAVRPGLTWSDARALIKQISDFAAANECEA